MMCFLAGARYLATACMDGGGRFVATCAGRADGAPTFSAGFALAPERVMVVDGREIAFVRDARGQLFSMSAAAPLGDDEEARTGGRWCAALSRLARAAWNFFVEEMAMIKSSSRDWHTMPKLSRIGTHNHPLPRLGFPDRKAAAPKGQGAQL